MASSRHHARPSEPAADVLTSLPAHLLDGILTRLDLRDTVRTSALSRAWRRRWEALPYLSLAFLDNPRTPPAAVDSVLLRYPGHISHFSFQLDEHSVGRVADWLIALCNRGVKSINLQHSPSLAIFVCGFALHSSVFLCTQLVYLELHFCRIPPLPVGFIGFPVLEELKLYAAQFPENGEGQLEAILDASPLLNTLNLSFSTIDLENYVSSGNFEGFIARFAQVRKLILHTSYPPPPLTNGYLMETLPCMFNNLKSLVLWTHFFERPAILSTFCLLTNAPNLEELEITIARGGEEEIEANAVYQNTQLTDAFCAKLQVVKIDGFGWFPNEMCFIELVLSKAIVLLTMRLGFISLKSNKDALCELMTYRRASPHAQVFYNGEMQ
ncbi:unnamed protein product [Alopecurus aequalis]